MNTRLSSIAFVASAFVGTWSLDARAAPETYRFDPVHTQIWFSASHENLSHPLGRLRIKDGWFQFDPNDLASAKVYVEIDLASVDMGDQKWSDTIRSGQFFDTSQFPTARYASTSVTPKDKASGTIHGDLILHGVTKSIDVEFKFNRAANDPYTFKRKAGFSAQAKLNRNDFDMKRYQDVVGQDIALTIEIEGIKDDGAARQNDAKPEEKKDDAGKE